MIPKAFESTYIAGALPISATHQIVLPSSVHARACASRKLLILRAHPLISATFLAEYFL